MSNEDRGGPENRGGPDNLTGPADSGSTDHPSERADHAGPQDPGGADHATPEDPGGRRQPEDAVRDSGIAESGSQQKPVEISDPRALRALAHPARLAILQHLVLDGPATATECAEVAGLSPSACSYHLRALARYGFADEDPSGGADRRHRPWRARYVSMTVGSDPSRPAAVRAASRLLVETVQARFDEVRADYYDREADFPPEWQQAADSSQDVLHVTPAELEEISASIHEILARNRRLNRQDQPPGARRVHVMLNLTPWFTPEPGA
jgi:DNA-binding transcriptional ArsR family regulator